jgi:hypothetical protein
MEEFTKLNKQETIAKLQLNGKQLEFVPQFKGDKDVVLAAVKQNGEALKFASEELQGDKGFMMAVVAQNGVALEFASEELQGDKEVVMAAVKQNGVALNYVSEELKADKEFMMAAVKQNRFALKYAPEELQGDKEFVLAAVTQNGEALEYVSEELRQDKEVVLAAVTQNGEALEYASEELKHDEEFIMDVVTKNKDFILYVDSFKDEESKELLKSVIKLALSNDGLLLAKLPDLYVTEEMCVTAVRQNNYAYQYVPERFLTPELVKLLPVRLGPPSLTRQVSETKSNQTSASTCSYHSMSRLFLQNRFIFVKPLQVDDIYDKNDCNGFLIPVNIEKTGLDTLDDAKCSPGGYDKILLFLYIYFLLKETNSCKKKIGELIPRQVDAIEMPDFLKRTKHEPRLLSLLREIKHLSSELRWKEYSFSFNTIEEPILFSVVQKLINLKFYVQLTCCGGREIYHAVTIVGVQEGNYIIKNSWSVLVDIVPSIKFFYLKGWPTPWMGTELLIYIPIISSEPTDGVKGKDYAISKLTRFDAWLDDYTAEIQRKPKGGRKTKRKKGTRRIKHKRTKRKLK